MTNENDALVADLVEWVARRPRDYAEVMDAWRTSCPRLTIWEDAVERGLVERVPLNGGTVVQATDQGRNWLRQIRPAAA